MAVAVQEERGETQVFDASSGETIFPTDRHREALQKGMPQEKGTPRRLAPLSFTPDITKWAKDLKDAQWSAIAANVPSRLCFSHGNFLVSEHFLGYGLSIVAIGRVPKGELVKPQLTEPWAALLVTALDKYVETAGLNKPNMSPSWPASPLAPRRMCIPADGWAVAPQSPHLVTLFGNRLYLWNLQSGEGRVLCDDSVVVDVDHRTGPTGFVFSPNGKLLAVYLAGSAAVGIHGAHELQIWDTESWTLVCRTKEEGTLHEPRSDNLAPRAFSPDNTKLLCANGTVRDAATNAVLADLDVASDDGGAGWASDSLHFCVMDTYVVPDTAGRYDGDIFIYNWQTERLAVRLRHDMSPTKPGQSPERLGEAGKMVMGLSPDGRHLGVCSQDRLCIWDVPKDILPAVGRPVDYPKGDGSEEHPIAVTPADLHAAFVADQQAATQSYVGKWVAMPGWRMRTFEPSTTQRPGHFLITLKNAAGDAGIKAYVPFANHDHRQRLNDPLKPPFVGRVEGVSREADGSLRVNVGDCDILSSTPDLKEAELVPITPAPPISLAQFKGLRKGMTMEDVKKLFGGTGDEKWQEQRTKARSQAGEALSYDEVSQRITVTYKGSETGSQVVLVFEGEKQLHYRLVQASQVGLE